MLVVDGPCKSRGSSASVIWRNSGAVDRAITKGQTKLHYSSSVLLPERANGQFELYCDALLGMRLHLASASKAKRCTQGPIQNCQVYLVLLPFILLGCIVIFMFLSMLLSMLMPWIRQIFVLVISVF